MNPQARRWSLLDRVTKNLITRKKRDVDCKTRNIAPLFSLAIIVSACTELDASQGQLKVSPLELHTAPGSGENWTPPAVPHNDGTPSEHGFVSLLPWSRDQLLAVWLDGRNLTETGEGEMQLRYARTNNYGTVLERGLVDENTCTCCQTAAASLPGGVIAAFRDRSDTEVRDTAYTRFQNGQWTAPQPVHADGWAIKGCPVNGSALATYQNAVAMAWFTAAQDSPRIHLSFSADTGGSFSTPIRVDGGSPLGRLDMVLLNRDTALVSWMEALGDNAAILVKWVKSSGSQGPATIVAMTSAARSSGYPKMALQGDMVVFAWTEVDTKTQVKTALAATKQLMPR
jgi:hypothetical protein